MHRFWIQAAMMFGGVLRGTVGGALSYLNTLLKSGLTSAMQFHQEGIAFARELGMNAKEAQAYTAVLTERTEKLAMTYGVAAEQVKELQRNISVATSRQLMLNDSQAEQFLQLNKLVGSNTVTQFTEGIMNGMGGSLDAVSGAVSKAYATAAKSGLNAQKVSEKIASNLGMANRLSFRNGVEGLTRMAIQAEKMGMSLQSVESAAGQFLELDQAIQNAAQMQMLGGSAAVNFGNPLTASYEANYDPEAFAKRLQNSLASYATFDAKSGVANVNGMNMDFVRNIAKTMGISTEEATKMAKKQAEIGYKERNISGAYKGMGLSQEQIDFLINKSNVSNGKVEFTTSNGEKVDLSSGQAIDQNVLNEMMKYEGMSDKDIMAQNAKTLTSINEQLIGIKDSIVAMFSKFVQGMFPKMQGDIKNFGAWAKNNLEPVAKNVGVAARGIYDWFKDNKETIKTLAKGIFGFLKFATEHWKLTLLALGSLKFLKFLGNAGIIDNTRLARGGVKAASRAGKGAWSGIKKMGKLTTSRGFWDVALGRQNKNSAGRWVNSKGRFISNRLANVGKVAKIGGAALGVGLGAYNAITADNAADRGAGIGTAVGTALGAVIGGPVGAAIGGFLGDFGGRFIGEHWDDITGAVSKAWTSIKDWFVKAWDGWLGNIIDWVFPIVGVIRHWDTISDWVGKKFNSILGLWDKAVATFQKFCDDPWGTVKSVAKSAWNGVFGSEEDNIKAKIAAAKGEKHADGGFINTGAVGVESPVLAQKGEVILNPAQQKNFMALANNYSSVTTNNAYSNNIISSILPKVTEVMAKPVGEKEYIYTPNRNETSNVNGNTITVKDFNINLSGTLKLDGGNNSRNIDVNSLLNDFQFMNALKEMIKTSINQDMNGGRYMNDLATMRGHTSSSSIIGR